MNWDKSEPTVMGFARYRLNDGATTEQLIDSSWSLKQNFLSQRQGIVGHWLLGNIAGEFADAILAVDENAFDSMSAAYATNEHTKAVLSLIDPGTIRLSKNNILKPGVKAPTDFACIEYGTFKPKLDGEFSTAALLAASKNIEEQYLSQSTNTIEHFMAQIDADTYAEVAFGKTLGQTRRTCFGYLENPVCQELLNLYDPETADLDFWYVLD